MWEYLVVSMRLSEPQQVMDQLNDLGAHGWEMVAVHPNHQLMFKRPRLVSVRAAAPQPAESRALTRTPVPA